MARMMEAGALAAGGHYPKVPLAQIFPQPHAGIKKSPPLQEGLYFSRPSLEDLPPPPCRGPQSQRL